MVYHDHVVQGVSNNAYSNETFRAKNGYKETHQHDPTYRRNRDFKPVGYGTFRGLPNYRHSEPYCLLKNMKDLPRQDHHHPIKYIKTFLTGATVGSVAGYMYFVGGPTGSFEMSKLLAAVGNRPFSGRGFRLMQNVLGKYALMGGSLFLSYQMIHDFLRHHDEANGRPMFFDHMIATTTIGTVLGGFYLKSPVGVFCSMFFSIVLVSPTMWWFKNKCKLNHVRPANIFYENGTTAEEVERFRN